MRLALALVVVLAVVGLISAAGCSTALADPTPIGGSCSPGKVCKAARFVSTSSTTNVNTGPLTATGNFSCDSNPATSSPCLSNNKNPMEIGGVHQFGGTPQAESSCIYMGCMEDKDGGNVLTVMNNYGAPGGGTEKHSADFRWNGDLWILGQQLIGNKGAFTDFRVGANTGALYLYTNDGLIYVINNGTSTDIAEWYGGTGTATRMILTKDGLLNVRGGVATTADAIATPAGFYTATDRSLFGRLPMHGNGTRLVQVGGGVNWALEQRSLTINPFMENSSLCPRCTECKGTTLSAMDGQTCTNTGSPTTSIVDGIDFYNLVTGAVSTNTSSWISANDETRRNKYPHMVWTAQLPATTLERVWYGLSSVALNGSDTPTGQIVAFRYSTNAADTKWQFCTGDGSTTSCSDTGVTVAANRSYRLEADCRDSAAGKCIATIVAQVTGAATTIQKTTNLPTPGNNMRPRVYCETLTSAAKTCGLGPSVLETL